MTIKRNVASIVNHRKPGPINVRCCFNTTKILISLRSRTTVAVPLKIDKLWQNFAEIKTASPLVNRTFLPIKFAKIGLDWPLVTSDSS